MSRMIIIIVTLNRYSLELNKQFNFIGIIVLKTLLLNFGDKGFWGGGGDGGGDDGGERGGGDQS